MGELFCRQCDVFLGFVRDGTFTGAHRIMGKRVQCSYCFEHQGEPVLTKTNHALPLGIPQIDAPAPTRYSSSVSWTLTYDEDGRITAAICEVTEVAEAA